MLEVCALFLNYLWVVQNFCSAFIDDHFTVAFCKNKLEHFRLGFFLRVFARMAA